MELLTILSRIHREIRDLGSLPAPSLMFYLNDDPPYAQARYPDGATFKIFCDGSTQMLIAGMPVPVSGCPAPEAIFRLNTGLILWKHRRWLPIAVLSIAALAALQFLLSLVPGAPGAAWFIDYFSAAMNAALLTLFVVCLIAAVLHNFRRGIIIRLDKPDTSGLLEAGNPDISPDILIVSASDTETPAEFAERVRAGYTDMLPRGQYMLVLSYRSPSGLIVRFPDMGSQEVFHRANLTKDIPGWMQEVCDTRMFEHETWVDFRAYVRAFCIQYIAWAQNDKLRQGNPLRDMLSSMEAAGRKMAAVCLLSLMSFAAVAQSAVPVPERFGGGKGPLTASTSTGITIPDSNSLEQMKIAFMAERAAEWRATEPVVDYVMWRFEISFLVIFIGLGGILWVIASVAARDSVKDIYGSPIFGNVLTRAHLWSKGLLFIILTIISVMYLGEAVVRYYYTGGMPTLWTIIKWAIICYLWHMVFEMILPDTPGAKADHRGGNNYPRIG